MTTGQLIRKARKKAGMTQAELAQKLNVPFQSVSQWERDLRNPKQETLTRIARALGVHILSLTDWDSIEAAGPDEVEPPEIMEEILKDYPYQTPYGPMSGEDIDKVILKQMKKGFPSDKFFYEAYLSGDIGAALLENKMDRRLISAYTKLDQSGQSKVADYAEDILPRYRRQDAPQSTLNSNEGKDTTPPPDATETASEGE